MSDTESYELRRAAEPAEPAEPDESDRDLREADAAVRQHLDDDAEQVKADAKRAEGIVGDGTEGEVPDDDQLHRDASRLSEEG